MGYDFVTSLRNKRYINIEQVLLEYQDSLSNAGSCEVDGVLWGRKSDVDLSKKLGKSIAYVSYLKANGLSYPEIIRQGLGDGSDSGNSTKDMSLFKNDDGND
jgi:hypothetical protein